MTTENEVKIVPNYKITWPDFEQLKVEIKLSLSVKDWRRFLQHAEKTGNPIVRDVQSVVESAIQEIDARKKWTKEGS